MAEVSVSVVAGGLGLLVVPRGYLDRATTAVVIDALGAAAAAGTGEVMVDLAHACGYDDAFLAVLAAPVVTIWCSESRVPSVVTISAASSVRVRANGMLEVAVHGGRWIIDVRRGRLCRVDGGVNPLFVPDGGWLEASRVEIDQHRLRAVPADGSPELVAALASPCAA